MDINEEEVEDLHQYIHDPKDFHYDPADPPLILPEVGFRVELGGKIDNPIVELEDKEKHGYYYRE
jgi:hypothetical protein